MDLFVLHQMEEKKFRLEKEREKMKREDALLEQKIKEDAAKAAQEMEEVARKEKEKMEKVRTFNFFNS